MYDSPSVDGHEINPIVIFQLGRCNQAIRSNSVETYLKQILIA
jgi:hypothetical protein